MTDSRDFMPDALKAARCCWDDEETKDMPIDPRLMNSIAMRLANWMETAARESGNRDYYRGLCIQCVDTLAGSHKERMFKTDDGGTAADPLLDRLPEVINDMSAYCHSAEKRINEFTEITADCADLLDINTDSFMIDVAKQIPEKIREINKAFNDSLRECAGLLGITHELTLRGVAQQIPVKVAEMKAASAKDCELIGEIHKAAGFKSGRPAAELPGAIANMLNACLEVQEADRNAAKIREYDEHFAQCIRILDLKPGADVPGAIVAALVKSRRVQDSPLPTAEENPNGLHQRYIVTKADGTPVDPEAVYFVLRLDPDNLSVSENRIASRYAALAYAYIIKRNGELALEKVADDLIDMIGIDIKFFERMIATSVLSFIARELTFEVGSVEDRTDLMTRANAWHVLMNTIGI